MGIFGSFRATSVTGTKLGWNHCVQSGCDVDFFALCGISSQLYTVCSPYFRVAVSSNGSSNVIPRRNDGRTKTYWGGENVEYLRETGYSFGYPGRNEGADGEIGGTVEE